MEMGMIGLGRMEFGGREEKASAKKGGV